MALDCALLRLKPFTASGAFAVFFVGVFAGGRLDRKNDLQFGLRQALDIIKRPAELFSQPYLRERPFLLRRHLQFRQRVDGFADFEIQIDTLLKV